VEPKVPVVLVELEVVISGTAGSALTGGKGGTGPGASGGGGGYYGGGGGGGGTGSGDYGSGAGGFWTDKSNLYFFSSINTATSYLAANNTSQIMEVLETDLMQLREMEDLADLSSGKYNIQKL
jgi:hypothetical protein